jgi:hypothetical protein
MDSTLRSDTPCSRADAEVLAEAWLVRLKYDWAFDALSMLVVTDPESAWRVIGLLLSRATESPTLIDIGEGPLTELLHDHAERFVERVEALAWSSPAFAQALENVWLVESESEIARRLIRVGCQYIGMERAPPVYAS